MADDQDPRVIASQDEWRATRQLLNGHRHQLAQTAAGLYPQASLGRVAPAGAGCLELAWRWQDDLLRH